MIVVFIKALKFSSFRSKQIHITECAVTLTIPNGVVTSPGFPHHSYRNGADCTWLIQLPLGQYIRIDFVSFDVELFYTVWYVTVECLTEGLNFVRDMSYRIRANRTPLLIRTP